jgi:hypothetical protein
MHAWNELVGKHPWIVSFLAVIAIPIAVVVILNKASGAKHLIGNRIRQIIANWRRG